MCTTSRSLLGSWGDPAVITLATAHYNILQHTATHDCTTPLHCSCPCHSTLQHTATHCNTPLRFSRPCHSILQHTAKHCNILLHSNRPCHSTLQHIARHCNTLQHIPRCSCPCHNTLQHTATRCNILPRCTSLCHSTLQHITTHCNTLQHIKTHVLSLSHALYLWLAHTLTSWHTQAHFAWRLGARISLDTHNSHTHTQLTHTHTPRDDCHQRPCAAQCASIGPSLLCHGTCHNAHVYVLQCVAVCCTFTCATSLIHVRHDSSISYKFSLSHIHTDINVVYPHRHERCGSVLSNGHRRRYWHRHRHRNRHRHRH